MFFLKKFLNVMICSEAGVETASQWVPAFEYQSLGISKITGDLFHNIENQEILCYDSTVIDDEG